MSPIKKPKSADINDLSNNDINHISNKVDKTELSNHKLLADNENNSKNDEFRQSNLKQNLKNRESFIRKEVHKSMEEQLNINNKGKVYLSRKDYLFARCSYNSISNYFAFSYFIRVYQLTLVKIVFNFAFIITYSKYPESQIRDSSAVFAYFVFLIWVILLPVILLTYLRNKQTQLMSRKYIVKFGSLYLNFRGISKDIYAILMQVKFILVPFFIVYFSDTGDFIYYICGIIYIYYILFVTISKPFSKVWKVFNESLSYLILIIFCFSIVLLKKFDSNYASQSYANYTYLSLILSLLVIRSFRIFIDTTKRILDVKKMRMPKEDDFIDKDKIKTLKKLNDFNIEINNNLDYLHSDLIRKDKKAEKQVEKEEANNIIKEFDFDENAEYNVEEMNDDDSEHSENSSKTEHLKNKSHEIYKNRNKQNRLNNDIIAQSQFSNNTQNTSHDKSNSQSQTYSQSYDQNQSQFTHNNRTQHNNTNAYSKNSNTKNSSNKKNSKEEKESVLNPYETHIVKSMKQNKYVNSQSASISCADSSKTMSKSSQNKIAEREYIKQPRSEQIYNETEKENSENHQTSSYDSNESREVYSNFSSGNNNKYFNQLPRYNEEENNTNENAINSAKSDNSKAYLSKNSIRYSINHSFEIDQSLNKTELININDESNHPHNRNHNSELLNNGGSGKHDSSKDSTGNNNETPNKQRKKKPKDFKKFSVANN